MDFKNYIFNDAPSPIMGTILRGGMDDGKGSWYTGKGKGKGAHGRRPVPLGPRSQMPPTVPPRPKLMPTTIRHGGAWMQCLLWVPFQPGASPQMPPLFSCAGAPPPPPPPNTSGSTTPMPTGGVEATVPEATPAALDETGPLEGPTDEEANVEEDCGSQTCVFEFFFFDFVCYSMLFICFAHLQCSRMPAALQILALLMSCQKKKKQGMWNPPALGL